MNRMIEIAGCALFVVAAGIAQGASPGDVIVTEIMNNPEAVGDTQGEWVELYNSTAASIDVNGWTIGDGQSEEHTIDAGGALSIAPQGFLVMGRNGDAALNGGYTADYVYSGMTLGNAVDRVVIRESGVTIDSVAYDDGATFPDPTGASMELDDPGADNNIGANWEENVTDLFGDGDYGTPGGANASWTSMGGPPVFVTVDQTPPFPSSADVVAIGVQVTDDGLVDHVGLYYRANGGAYTLLTMTSAGGGWYDSQIPAYSDGDVVEWYVCATDDEAETSYEPPGAPASVHQYAVSNTLPAVSINEVLADPGGDANGDGTLHTYEDEFVEIYNSGLTSVDLSGWILSDDDGLGAEFIFPGGTTIGSGEYITLFGGGVPTGLPGQVFVDDGRIGNGLSNTGDTINLIRAGELIDEFTYGSEGNHDESMIRVPDGIGTWTRPSVEGRGWSFSPQVTNGGGTTRTQPASWGAVKRLFF